jgi:hypothetical protein
MKKWMWWIIILGGLFAVYWFFFRGNPENGTGGEGERRANARLARIRNTY